MQLLAPLTVARTTLNKYIMSKIDSIVFSRYGYEYLQQFAPEIEDAPPIGSHRINLD